MLCGSLSAHRLQLLCHIMHLAAAVAAAVAADSDALWLTQSACHVLCFDLWSKQAAASQPAACSQQASKPHAVCGGTGA